MRPIHTSARKDIACAAALTESSIYRTGTGTGEVTQVTGAGIQLQVPARECIMECIESY